MHYITTPSRRGQELARMLAHHVARPGGQPRRYYMTDAAILKWRTLFNGGWSPNRDGTVRRYGVVRSVGEVVS